MQSSKQQPGENQIDNKKSSVRNGNENAKKDPWLDELESSRGGGYNSGVRWLRLKVGVPTTIRFPSVCNMDTFKEGKKRMDKNNPDKLTDCRLVMVTTPEEPNEQVEFTITSKRLYRAIASAINDDGYSELVITAKGEGTNRTYDVKPSREAFLKKAREELQREERQQKRLEAEAA